MDLLSYGAAKIYASKGRESLMARSLMATLGEGQKSIVMYFVGDSTGNETTEYPALFATKLAEKFPTYNVKYKVYSPGINAYTAFSNLVANGAERHIAITPGKSTLELAKAEIPITSPDLDIRIKIALDDWDEGTARIVMGRYGAAGTRSWYMGFGASNYLQFYWSANGTDLISKPFTNIPVAAYTDGEPYWFRVTLDVDNGAGKYTVKAYTSTDGITWTEKNTADGDATTSVFDHESQAYELGGAVTSTSVACKIYEVQMRNGIDGYNVCPQPIEAWHQTVADSLNGGVVGGYPTIYLYNASVAGLTTTDAATAAFLGKTVPVSNNPFVIISLGHNDGKTEGTEYYALLDTLVSAIKVLLPRSIIGILTQNPHTSTGGYVLPHSKRREDQITYCFLNHLEVIDAYGDFIADPRGVAALLNVDGLHPNADGETVITEALWNYVNIRGK